MRNRRTRQALRPATPPSDPDVLEFEAAFSRTAPASRLHKRIMRLQHRLKSKLDAAGWRLYLDLENAVNERQAALLDYIQRCLAFHGKQRSRAQRSSRTR